MSVRDNSTLQGIEAEIRKLQIAQVVASKAKYIFPKISSSVFFPTGTWEDLRLGDDGQMGDFISVGSSAVVKSTPDGRALTGKLPMIANERLMSSNELKRVASLGSVKANKDAYAEEYVYRTQLNIDGVLKLLEVSGLQALSNGLVTLNGKNIEDVDVNYMIPKENKTGVTEMDKITYKEVVEFTRGKGIVKAFASQYEIDLLGSDQQMKDQYAMIVGGLPSNAILGLAEINRVFEREGFVFTLVPTFIQDGTRKIEPWKKGVITFVGSDRVMVIGHSLTPEAIDQPFTGGVRNMLNDYSMMTVIEYQTNPYRVSNRIETYAVPILASAEYTYIMDSKVQNV